MPDNNAPFAILFIENVRSGRTAMVYGLSGKRYEFRWNEEHKRLLRTYDSAAMFTAEEMDIRKNLRQSYVILTMLGSTNALINAKDALKVLVGANRTTSIIDRRKALVDLAETAMAAVKVIDAPPEDEAPDHPLAPQKPHAPLATDMRAVRLDPPVRAYAPPSDALTKPVEVGGIHTQEELMRGEIAGVRAIAKKLEISIHQPTGGAKSREMLVKDIMAAEQQKAV